MAQEKGGHGGFHTAHRLKGLLTRKPQHDNHREGEGDAGALKAHLDDRRVRGKPGQKEGRDGDAGHGEEQSVKGGQRHGQGHRGQKGAKNVPILGSA